MTKSPPCRLQGRLSTGFYCSEVRSLEMTSAIFLQPWSGQAYRACGSRQPLWRHENSIRPVTERQVVRPGVDPAMGSSEQWAGLWGKAKAPRYNRSCFGWPPASTATLMPSLCPSVPLSSFPAPIQLFLEVYMDNKDFPLQ